MDGGPSKINPPNSHPSNPIYKAAMTAQNPKLETPQKKTAAADEALETKTPQHEINKKAVIVVVVGVVALLFMPLDVLLKNENNRRENKKPGVLGKVADCLSGGFEKEADDRAD